MQGQVAVGQSQAQYNLAVRNVTRHQISQWIPVNITFLLSGRFHELSDRIV